MILLDSTTWDIRIYGQPPAGYNDVFWQIQGLLWPTWGSRWLPDQSKFFTKVKLCVVVVANELPSVFLRRDCQLACMHDNRVCYFFSLWQQMKWFFSTFTFISLPIFNHCFLRASCGMKYTHLQILKDFELWILFSVTRLGDLLDFWQVFEAFGSNKFAQVCHILKQFL